MIRTLDRYLLGTFFVTYIMSLGVLVSLYIVLDLLFNVDEFTEDGVGFVALLTSVGDYYLYNIPLYFSQISGVITLFAACGTMVRLQRQNEVTAVLASGTSLYRIAAPIVLAGLAMNFLVVLDYEVILPKIAPKLVRMRDDVEGTRPYSVWCVKDGPGRLVSAMKFVPKEQGIRTMVIMNMSTEPQTRGRLDSVVTADKAYWDGERGGWRLERGVLFSRAGGERSGLSVDNSVKRESVSFYRSKLNPDELLLRQNTQWIRFLSIRQLLQLENSGIAEGQVISQIKHGRFTAPINNMILLLIGLSFFLSRLPEGILTQCAKALTVSAVVFLVSFIGQQFVGSLGADSAYPFVQALPAWLPIFLFGPLAVVMMEGVKT